MVIAQCYECTSIGFDDEPGGNCSDTHPGGKVTIMMMVVNVMVMKMMKMMVMIMITMTLSLREL